MVFSASVLSPFLAKSSSNESNDVRHEKLPIDDALPALVAALRSEGRVVLQAPPGAGKTTRVPLVLLEASLADLSEGGGRILMLEPRRLATRAAAERMAQSLGEKVGQTVGYRIKGESVVGPATRIEVVTEGILTRMIQSDAELSGVSVVIFDEFHERSLNADLGLALAWEIRGALRPDLKLVVMSATLDAAPVAALLNDAPIVTSEGRAFAVETLHLPKPLAKTIRFEHASADLVAQAAQETEGGILVFLPGEGEIRRVAGLLAGRVSSDITIHTLFGAMSFADQRAAISPAKSGRKIVLATSIAETSLTIQDIQVVVDCGRARRARFDPNSGMSRLVTEPVSRAEAEQRRGRAGRVCAGTCYRLWTKGQEGALPAFAPAEVEAADLTSLVLELALWGAASPDELAFLTPPSAGGFAEAKRLLLELGALDVSGRITPHGRKIAALPVHPRLGHMLLLGGAAGAPLAALIAGRDPLRGAPSDVSLRLKAIENPKEFQRSHPYTLHRAAIQTLRSDAKSLARLVSHIKHSGPKYSTAELAALAYPDRIALRRNGPAPRFLLSGGKGAIMDEVDPLAKLDLLVATDLDGALHEARIRQAIPLSASSLRALFPDQIQWQKTCRWSRRDKRVIARREERLGALVLTEQHWSDAPEEQMAQAALEGIREIGLPRTAVSDRLLARIALFESDGFPQTESQSLLDSAETWLLPHLLGLKTEGQLRNFDPSEALRQMLTWEQTQTLDRLAPASFVTPLGNKVPIDYAGEAPEIAVRLQEMFGVSQHPTVGPTHIPLRITLLSPARKPLQTTADLPGFWATSYVDVRKDMRGRYPKHPWPDDPTQEKPTLRAKPRK
ncbi:ATP-dependent helicase HrpB [Falsihalocynthiibacter arcticus]|uniref:ATP-dependent helicase HrpB n=1 Tax=Falsihalocynthiibacter arcticus TaxID=1579316 RepID=UPI0009EEF0B1